MALTNDVMMTEDPNCSICSDTYTAILRKRITCKYCKQSICCKCIETYLLTKSEDAHCIHCRVHYNDKDLQSICTKTYLKDRYFKHRQEILISRERANLPGLQQAAHTEKGRRDRSNAINVLIAEIKELTEVRNTIRLEYIRLSLNKNEEELKKVGADLDYYLGTINLKKEQLYELRVYGPNQVRAAGAALAAADAADALGAAIAEAPEEKDERKKFIRRCMRRNCNGFLSTAWKCGLCEWYSCSKCFTERGPEHDTPHECKKEDVETAELIRSDSKPCPNCGEFINKSSGCDQMYCISCQTPFSWTTLKIVTSGVIHNPHYYEMMRRKGGAPPRNPGDVPCGGFPAVWQLIDHPRGVRAHVTEYYREFHRLCQEVQDVSLRSYRTHVDNTLSTAINIQFLLNDFSEVKWGQKLAMNEKKRKRDAEIQEVFAAFLMVAVNIINTVQNYLCPVRGLTFPQLPVEDAEKILMDLHAEITELIAIMNDAFKGISVSYSYTVPYIESRMGGVPHLAMYRLQAMNFKTKSRAQHMEDDDDE